MLGREKEAAQIAAEVLKLNPKFHVEGRLLNFKDQQKRNAFLDALRKAGLPE